MKAQPVPQIFIRQWLHGPHAIPVEAFSISALCYVSLVGLFIEIFVTTSPVSAAFPHCRFTLIILVSGGMVRRVRSAVPYVLVVGRWICAQTNPLYTCDTAFIPLSSLSPLHANSDEPS